MALETVVFQQDPFSCQDPWLYSMPRNHTNDTDHQDLEYYSSSVVQGGCEDLENILAEISTKSTTSSENGSSGRGGFPLVAAAATGRKKRRRSSRVVMKSSQDVEGQRKTHIAVERNRRRQMNNYLAVLRSMMPPSYVQRGDQASIVGAAINFVKELEQLHQSLRARQETNRSSAQSIFADFFTFPQYSTAATRHCSISASGAAALADVEVTVVDGHGNIKVQWRRQPGQLQKMVGRLHALRLHVLHLTLAAAGPITLLSFTVKVEESCVLNSANEIAAAVYEMVGKIQEEEASTLRALNTKY